MRTLKSLYETTYMPNGEDERRFWAKHRVKVTDYPVHNFDAADMVSRKAKRKADYDEVEDELVYEAINVITKRADKVPVTVHDVNPKTGQSRTRVHNRRAGEIKIGREDRTGRAQKAFEETDLTELSRATLGRYAMKAQQKHDIAARMYKPSETGEYNKQMGHIANKRFQGVRDSLAKLSGLARVNATEETDLTEALKVGDMVLHDGSHVKLTREMIDTIHHMLDQINDPKRRADMEHKMKENRKSFDEIWALAQKVR